MKNNDLKIGDVVVLKEGDPIAMVIEEIIIYKDKPVAKCVCMNTHNEVIRDNYTITSLELEIDGISTGNNADTKDHKFNINDYVVLKSGDVSMVIKEIMLKDKIYKAECVWSNAANETRRDIFHTTSLEFE